MRHYEVRLAMSTERRSLDSVQKRLEPVREKLERAGFHVSELSVHGQEPQEHKDLARPNA